MNLRKLKFKLANCGGNMQAFECFRRNHQILMGDNFGNPPYEGKDWSVSIFKKNVFGYSEEPVSTYSGKNFNLIKAEKKARQMLTTLLK